MKQNPSNSQHRARPAMRTMLTSMPMTAEVTRQKKEMGSVVFGEPQQGRTSLRSVKKAPSRHPLHPIPNIDSFRTRRSPATLRTAVMPVAVVAE